MKCLVPTLLWIAILALNIAGILSEVPSGFSWIDSAETFYHVRELSSGRVPHLDFFTHHFTGYLFPFYAFEFFTQITPDLFWVFAVIYNFAVCIFISLAVGTIAGPWYGYFAGIVSATIGWFPAFGGTLFLNQSYYAPILAAYFWSLVRLIQRFSLQGLIISSMLAGILTTNDQRLVPFSALLLIPVAYHRYSMTLPRLTTSLIAWSLFPVLMLGYFALYGALDDFFEQCFLFPVVFRNAGQEPSAMNTIASLAEQAFSLDPLTAVLLLAGLIVLLTSRLDGALKAVVFGFFLLSCLAVIAANRDFIHYLLFLGPITLAIISLFPYLLAGYFSKLKLATTVAILTFAVTVGISPLIRHQKYGSLFVQPKIETINEVVDFIRGSPNPKGDMLVWGYIPQIYLNLGKLSPFRDMGLLSVVGANYSSLKREHQGIMQTMERELIHLFETSPPEFVVVYNVRGDIVLKNGYHKDPYRMPSVPQPQFDFERIPHLQYFKNILENSYVAEKLIDNKADWATVYVLSNRSGVSTSPEITGMLSTTPQGSVLYSKPGVKETERSQER